MRSHFARISILACLCCSSFASPAFAGAPLFESASARFASSAADTAKVDSLHALERPSAWTMDELKTVLGRETGEKAAGGYRELKNGRLAMLCALLVPGLGQMYNEKPFKAAIGLGLETTYLSRILFNRRSMAREERIRDSFAPGSLQWDYHDRWAGEYRERAVDWIWYSGAVILVLVVDAYVDAHLADMHFSVGVGAAEGGIGAHIAFKF